MLTSLFFSKANVQAHLYLKIEEKINSSEQTILSKEIKLTVTVIFRTIVKVEMTVKLTLMKCFQIATVTQSFSLRVS